MHTHTDAICSMHLHTISLAMLRPESRIMPVPCARSVQKRSGIAVSEAQWVQQLLHVMFRLQYKLPATDKCMISWNAGCGNTCLHTLLCLCNAVISYPQVPSNIETCVCKSWCFPKSRLNSIAAMYTYLKSMQCTALQFAISRMIN